MDKSAITMTVDDDWWLERVTMDGEQRYPKRIRVGSLENPRVYVPERTAAVEVSHGAHGPLPRFPGDAWTMHHVCSACGGAVDKGDGYCRNCGARLADNEKE